MSCYHPNEMRFAGTDSETGQIVYKFVPKGTHKRSFDLDSFYNPDIPASEFDNLKHPLDVLVPCRKCIGCRLDYSRRWADRLMLELDHTGTALFFTLTYNDEHITLADSGYGNLVKSDLQLFNKRLRKHFNNKRIRFYACGEYGDDTLRPHYHGIYYGLSLLDFPDIELYKRNKHGHPLYRSKILQEDIWKNGHVNIGNVSWQSCAYVARYNLKKLKQGYDDLPAQRGCVPEFSVMSRKPGIAGLFYEDHPEILDNPTDKLLITDTYGLRQVSEVSMPSYLFEKLKLVNPELYDKIKEQRKEAATESFLAELSKTDLDEFEYMELKESLHENRCKRLVRD